MITIPVESIAIEIKSSNKENALLLRFDLSPTEYSLRGERHALILLIGKCDRDRIDCSIRIYEYILFIGCYSYPAGQPEILEVPDVLFFLRTVTVFLCVQGHAYRYCFDD